VQVLSSRRACPNSGRGFAEPDPRLLSFNSPQGWCLTCHGTGLEIKEFDADQTGEESQWLDANGSGAPCSACHGRRLNPVALHLRLGGRSISELTAMTVDELQKFRQRLRLDKRGRPLHAMRSSRSAAGCSFSHRSDSAT